MLELMRRSCVPIHRCWGESGSGGISINQRLSPNRAREAHAIPAQIRYITRGSRLSQGTYLPVTCQREDAEKENRVFFFLARSNQVGRETQVLQERQVSVHMKRNFYTHRFAVQRLIMSEGAPEVHSKGSGKGDSFGPLPSFLPTLLPLIPRARTQSQHKARDIA